MNLAEALLEKLNEWTPAGEGRQTGSFALPDHGWTVDVTAERVDTLGCRLSRLDATRTASLPDDAAALEAHARAAAKRTTGLLEPLRLLEIDKGNHVAVLRSENPPAKGDSVSYYEVEFRGRNKVSVQRFKASTAGPARKEGVPFVLTHEAVAKVMDDLTRA